MPDITIKFYIVTCANCAIQFGISDDWDERLRKSHRNFYCPNGHSNTYKAKTNEEIREEKLKESLAEANLRIVGLENDLINCKRKKKKRS